MLYNETNNYKGGVLAQRFIIDSLCFPRNVNFSRIYNWIRTLIVNNCFRI